MYQVKNKRNSRLFVWNGLSGVRKRIALLGGEVAKQGADGYRDGTCEPLLFKGGHTEG